MIWPIMGLLDQWFFAEWIMVWSKEMNDTVYLSQFHIDKGKTFIEQMVKVDIWNIHIIIQLTMNDSI